MRPRERLAQAFAVDRIARPHDRKKFGPAIACAVGHSCGQGRTSFGRVGPGLKGWQTPWQRVGFFVWWRVLAGLCGPLLSGPRWWELHQRCRSTHLLDQRGEVHFAPARAREAFAKRWRAGAQRGPVAGGTTRDGPVRAIPAWWEQPWGTRVHSTRGTVATPAARARAGAIPCFVRWVDARSRFFSGMVHVRGCAGRSTSE